MKAKKRRPKRRQSLDGLPGDSVWAWVIGGVALLLFSQKSEIEDTVTDAVTGVLVRNRSRADGINPLLQAALDEWNQVGPFPISIGSGVRSNAQQLALWWLGRDAEGKVVDESKHATNAKDTTQTSHGIRSGYGNAFDADPVPATQANYQVMGEWFEARGFEWGGRWLRAFPPSPANPLGGDRRHIDVKGWESIPI